MAFGAASLIALGVLWAVQEWRIRGERLETAKVQVVLAAGAVKTAGETNAEMVKELAAADRRRVADLQALDEKHRRDLETLSASRARRSAALRQRGTDADGPVAPVVLDWLQRVRRPGAAVTDRPGPAAPAP